MKIDKLVSELCEEIDNLEKKVEYWEKSYVKLYENYQQLLKSCEKHNNKIMQNVLDLTLKTNEKF